MSNARANKAKGRRWESQLVDYLTKNGLPSERRRLAGRADKGDVVPTADSPLQLWTLEAKNVQRINLSDFMRQASDEADNAGTPFYAAVIKKRQKPVGDAYVVMPLSVFVAALHRMTNPNERN